MIAFLIFGLAAIYFFYLNRWADSFLLREYHFGSPSPPKVLPHSSSLSLIVAILWGIFLLAGVFWGYTFVRYPDYLSIRGSGAEVVLLVVLFVAVALSYVVVYRLGEMRGVAHMKNTNLFIAAMRDKQ